MIRVVTLEIEPDRVGEAHLVRDRDMIGPFREAQAGVFPYPSQPLLVMSQDVLGVAGKEIVATLFREVNSGVTIGIGGGID